jgi:hypothetical protein
VYEFVHMSCCGYREKGKEERTRRDGEMEGEHSTVERKSEGRTRTVDAGARVKASASDRSSDRNNATDRAMDIIGYRDRERVRHSARLQECERWPWVPSAAPSPYLPELPATFPYT